MIAGAKRRPRNRTAGAVRNESRPFDSRCGSRLHQNRRRYALASCGRGTGFWSSSCRLSKRSCPWLFVQQRRFEHERFSPKKTERTFEPAPGHTPKTFFFAVLSVSSSASQGSSHHGDRSGFLAL